MTTLSGIITPSNVATDNNTLTLTNKTINGSNNTVTNISLATGVTGTLPVANGGTGTTSTTFVNLATNVTGTLPAANGGTANGFFAVTGPATSTKNYTFPNENMKVGYLNIPQSGSAKTTSYQLATTDVGEFIEIGSGGSITIPDATFSAGDVIVLFNNTSGNITVTCSITTAYIAGTNTDKATVTLATRGLANVMFISGTVCVISGNVT